MVGQLERAVSRFSRGPGREAGSKGATLRVSAAFRAAVEQRLRNLEREIGEVKGRINGLIFVVIGAVITQVVLRVMQ